MPRSSSCGKNVSYKNCTFSVHPVNHTILCHRILLAVHIVSPIQPIIQAFYVTQEMINNISSGNILGHCITEITHNRINCWCFKLSFDTIQCWVPSNVTLSTTYCRSKLKYLNSYNNKNIHLSEVGSQQQQAKQGIPVIPLPSNAFQPLLRDPEAFPDQLRYIISPSESWIYPRVSSQLDVPRKHPKGGSHPNQMPKPPQLAPLKPKWSGSIFELLPDVRAPRSISEAATLQIKLISAWVGT